MSLLKLCRGRPNKIFRARFIVQIHGIDGRHKAQSDDGITGKHGSSIVVRDNNFEDVTRLWRKRSSTVHRARSAFALRQHGLGVRAPFA
jgi:hypothetical protein